MRRLKFSCKCWLLLITLTLLPVIIAYVAYLFNFALRYDHWGISDKPEVWGQFGDFINFSVTLTLGIANLAFLGYLAFIANKISSVGNRIALGANNLAGVANGLAMLANELQKAGIEKQLKFEILKDFLLKLDRHKDYITTNRAGQELFDGLTQIRILAEAAKADFKGLFADADYNEFEEFCTKIIADANGWENGVDSGLKFEALCASISEVRTLVYKQIRMSQP